MPSRPLPQGALILAAVCMCLSIPAGVRAQDYDTDPADPPPMAQDSCIGVFLTYNFISRTEYPHVKNASAQSWAFKSTATVINTMAHNLDEWKMFIGFQHDEILVSVSGAVITDGTDFPAHVGNGTDFPAHVGNGTTMCGYPQTDLLNSMLKLFTCGLRVQSMHSGMHIKIE